MHIEKNILTQKFIRELKSVRTIAKELNTTCTIVTHYLKKYNMSDITQTDVVVPENTILKGWKVISTFKGEKDLYYHKCKCVICGKEKELRAVSLYRGNHNECKCTRLEFNGEISIQQFEKIKESAKGRGLDFEITMDDITEQYNKQEGKCTYSKLDISFKPQYNNASLDRRVNYKGYTKDNIHVIHKLINMFKFTHPEEGMIILSHLIAENNPKPKETIKDLAYRNQTIMLISDWPKYAEFSKQCNVKQKEHKSSILEYII